VRASCPPEQQKFWCRGEARALLLYPGQLLLVCAIAVHNNCSALSTPKLLREKGRTASRCWCGREALKKFAKLTALTVLAWPLHCAACDAASTTAAAAAAAAAAGQCRAVQQQRRSASPSGSARHHRSAFSCNRQPVSWKSLALVSLTGAGLVTVYNKEKTRRLEGATCHASALAAGFRSH